MRTPVGKEGHVWKFPESIRERFPPGAQKVECPIGSQT
jgi:hypothetical protein